MIQELRKKKGWLQTELAEKSGVSYRMVRAYENGTRDINKAEFGTVVALAVTLEVPVTAILTDPKVIELCGRTRL